MGALNSMKQRYSGEADFRIVYVREAHPEDGWQVPENRRSGIEVKEPKSLSARIKVAEMCEIGLKLDIPILIDLMDDAVERAYAGWPDRIYIVGKDGKIAYKGQPGPRGFRPDLAEEALKRLLGAG